MWTYNQNPVELYHHGIKGQKWGVRRYQNEDGTLTSAGKRRLAKQQYKEMGRDKRKFQEEEYKRLYEKEDLEGERQKIFAFGKKHKLDLDDGGGGDEKAGAKYMNMWDKWESHHESIKNAAAQKASKRLIEKYGQESFDAMKDREARISKGMNAASVAMVLALPVALLAAGTALVVADAKK